MTEFISDEHKTMHDAIAETADSFDSFMRSEYNSGAECDDTRQALAWYDKMLVSLSGGPQTTVQIAQLRAEVAGMAEANAQLRGEVADLIGKVRVLDEFYEACKSLIGGMAPLIDRGGRR